MNTLKILSTLLLGLSVVASPALYADQKLKHRKAERTSYARVIAVEPVYRTVESRIPREECWLETVEEVREHQSASATPAVVGGIIGGTLGNALGKKHGHRQTATVVGALLGLTLGSDVGRKNRQPDYQETGYRDVERCETRYETSQRQRLIGYDVSYKYAGETYHTRTKQDPGARLPIAVRVQPLGGR